MQRGKFTGSQARSSDVTLHIQVRWKRKNGWNANGSQYVSGVISNVVVLGIKVDRKGRWHVTNAMYSFYASSL
jgi:hypothetical protein